MTNDSTNCPFSGRYCVKERCRAWIPIPGDTDKNCAIITAAVAQIITAHQSMTMDSDPFGIFGSGEDDE